MPIYILAFTLLSYSLFQDIAFINPANVVFVYLLVRDMTEENISKWFMKSPKQDVETYWFKADIQKRKNREIESYL